MRPLDEEEAKVFFEKLASFIGRNVKLLVDRTTDPHVFRLHKDRVYFVPEIVVKNAACIGRKDLVSLGICFGKFTKSKKFKLHITALPYLAQYAKYKVWVKSSAEMSFVYGNHILKAGLGRMTDNTPQYQAVVVYSMADVPLGFGATSRSTADCRRCDPTDIVVFNQSDTGLYLRAEIDLF